ncbi:asparagine synthase-related protein [Sphingomonas sp. MMS12-HWE2-04]|uniref:asparagine synthase-related protein n=1 Tax=Sphingomonas sp. MMS12-HWE2-04 TaxID=3234199 RepID=UPI0038514007
MRAAPYAWAPDPNLLNPEALEAAGPRPPHDWLDAPGDALPGRAAHIAKISRTQNYAEGLPRDQALEAVHPLLSQPIFELCLSIPSWNWVAGGRDRSVARAAFGPTLPQQTVTRRTKGGPGAFHRQVAHSRAPEIRDRLLGGSLAENGLLDVAAIEASLKSRADTPEFSYDRLLELVDTEAWIQRNIA